MCFTGILLRSTRTPGSFSLPPLCRSVAIPEALVYPPLRESRTASRLANHDLTSSEPRLAQSWHQVIRPGGLLSLQVAASPSRICSTPRRHAAWRSSTPITGPPYNGITSATLTGIALRPPTMAARQVMSFPAAWGESKCLVCAITVTYSSRKLRRHLAKRRMADMPQRTCDCHSRQRGRRWQTGGQADGCLRDGWMGCGSAKFLSEF
jgi:hypothetical protein